MLLSIVIPYYNRNAWIGKTLDSLLDQDLDPSEYEIIVVDDGSSEEPVVLKEYVEKYPNISCVQGGHHGQAVARNLGIENAKGEWLFFCDSDDYVQPQVFGGILAATKERNPEVIITSFRWVIPGRPEPPQHRNFTAVSEVMTGLEYLKNPPKPFYWGPGNILVRRSFLKSTGVMFPEIQFVEDRLFKLDLLPRVTRLVHIDVDLYYYVHNDESVLTSFKQKNLSTYFSVFPVYLERMTELIKDPVTPREAAAFLTDRRNNAAYRLLSNAFHSSPEAVASLVPRLKAMGSYPFPIRKKDTARVRLTKHLMNRRFLWPVLYRRLR